MRLITIPKDKAKYELGKAVVGGKFETIYEETAFLDWLEELAHMTPEFGKGINAAKRMRRLGKKIDDAVDKEVIKLESADWDDMKKKLDAIEYAPAKNAAVLEFMEAFVGAQEEAGAAGA